MCQKGFICRRAPGSDAGTCEALPKAGEACAGGGFIGLCASGLKCNVTSHKCAAAGDNGAACTDDSECWSDVCQAGKCQAPACDE
jgi:hypothetical protein